METNKTKSDKKGATNVELWNTINVTADKYAPIGDISVEYFDIDVDKDTDGNATYVGVNINERVTNMDTLVLCHERFLEQMNAKIAMAEIAAKGKLMQYIKEAVEKNEGNAKLRWEMSNGLTLEYRQQKKESDKKNYEGMILVNKNTKDERVFYKYKVNMEECSFNKMRTTWASTEIPAKYEKQLREAEVARANAEKAAREAEAEKKRKEEELKNLQNSNAELMRQMAEMRAMLEAMKNK